MLPYNLFFYLTKMWFGSFPNSLIKELVKSVEYNISCQIKKYHQQILCFNCLCQFLLAKVMSTTNIVRHMYELTYKLTPPNLNDKSWWLQRLHQVLHAPLIFPWNFHQPSVQHHWFLNTCSPHKTFKENIKEYSEDVPIESIHKRINTVSRITEHCKAYWS